MQALVLTVIGKDRPGLVESVARVIEAHEGSWVESRMVHLGGFFAGVLRADVPESNLDALKQGLAQLSASGLEVVVQATVAEDEDASSIQLELVGSDRVGIVRHVSEALAKQGVNVEELHTTREGAPHSGEILFRAQAKLKVPPQLDLGELRAELEAIASDLMVDITLADS